MAVCFWLLCMYEVVSILQMKSHLTLCSPAVVTYDAASKHQYTVYNSECVRLMASMREIGFWCRKIENEKPQNENQTLELV